MGFCGFPGTVRGFQLTGVQSPESINRCTLRRQSHLLVSARRQRGCVIRAESFRSQDVHVDLQRRAPAVHNSIVLRGQPRGTVRQLGTDGLQRGLRHRLHDILLQRSLRAQAPWEALVRHQSVLFRGISVRDHVVRRDGRLEDFRAVHRSHTARERSHLVQGEITFRNISSRQDNAISRYQQSRGTWTLHAGQQ